MSRELIALYELKRQAFLIGYIQNPKRFNAALAFAYYNRVAPIFHEQDAREVHDADPFEEGYAVKTDFVSRVIKFVDKQWLAQNLGAIGFYNLENEFGGHHAYRVELILTLEYARIAGRFDENVWAAIEGNAPAEATSLCAKFSPDDIYFE